MGPFCLVFISLSRGLFLSVGSLMLVQMKHRGGILYNSFIIKIKGICKNKG